MAQEINMDLEEHVKLLHDSQKSAGEKVDFFEDDICTDGARNGPGYVYLLSEHTRSNGQPTHYYKIGVSSKPNKRIADLQTGNPRPLAFQGEPILVSKVISAERQVHKAVASYASSLGGGQEWFYVPQQDWESFWNCFQKALREHTENSDGCTCPCTCRLMPTVVSATSS